MDTPCGSCSVIHYGGLRFQNQYSSVPLSCLPPNTWCKKKKNNNSVTRSISKVWSSGEGSGNPLQCSCLENARDGGAWWATVYGVAQSRPRLKRLSSSSSTINKSHISCVPVFIRQVSPFTLGLSLARPVLPFCVFYSI